MFRFTLFFHILVLWKQLWLILSNFQKKAARLTSHSLKLARYWDRSSTFQRLQAFLKKIVQK